MKTKKVGGSRLDWIDQVNVERFEMKRGYSSFFRR